VVLDAGVRIPHGVHTADVSGGDPAHAILCLPRTLTSLSIAGELATAAALEKGLPWLRNLARLDVSGSLIRNPGAKAISRAAPRLRMLRAAACGIGAAGVRALGGIATLAVADLRDNVGDFRPSPGLLRVSCLALSDVSPGVLGELFRHPGVLDLRIPDSPRLAGRVPGGLSAVLSSVSVPGSRLRGADMRRIASAAPNLASLDFSENLVADEAHDVAAALALVPRLARLDLGGNPLEDACAEAVAGFSGLRWLGLYATRCSASALGGVAAALPLAVVRV
jgi:hypothetical protein